MEDAPRTPLALDVRLPFSYWRASDLDRGDPALRPQPGVVGAYARALVAEIESLGADVKGRGYEVGSVFFSGGYLGLLDPEAFRDILRAVRRSFDVAARLRVDAVTFPGLVDMYAASAYLDEGLSALMFEVPTLSAREAVAHGLPNALQALDKSAYVLESYGAAELGLRLPADVPGRSRETWAYLLGQVNHYRPVHVELVGPDAHDEGIRAFGEGLEGAGYRRVACENAAHALFTRAEGGVPAPALLGYGPASTCERLGVGLGAETVLDGFWTKGTTDMGRYLAGASDYRSLVAGVRELARADDEA